MVLQQVETVEDAVVLQQVEATYIRHNSVVVDESNRVDALVFATGGSNVADTMVPQQVEAAG